MSNQVQSRLSGLEECPLRRKTPFGMRNVSMTQLSIARHYGCIRYNGEPYTYFADTDELVRDDVLKWQKKQEKARAKPAASQAAPESQQQDLLLSGEQK
jgi:hypothetical protein